MGEKLIVGPMTKGLRNDVEPFVIDNNSFPTLINAYQWRGKVKRKRGTTLLGRLQRWFNSTTQAINPGSSTQVLVLGVGNLLTGFSGSEINLGSSIVPGTVLINDLTSGNIYRDTNSDGTLIGTPSGSGTINYSTGQFTIVGGAANTINAKFLYYPNLPVMGLEEFVIATAAYPGTIAFDTTYSYNINTNYPFNIFNVSFYKNLATGTYPGYVQKSFWTRTSWNGQNYQQFWTVNYQGALFATNGINVPFVSTNIGMQFRTIENITVTSPTTVNITITTHGLVVGDFLFFNEINGVTGINFQTGYVTVRIDAHNITVTFPNAALAGVYTTGGIAQYLTNRSDITKDCIRWYDGSPVSNAVIDPSFVLGRGWVNYCPPLSQNPYSIANLPEAIYYLVGARMIVPFRDRLLFFGPVVQTSGGNGIYLQDTIIYSQNGTCYYTASYTNSPDPTVDTPTTSSDFLALLVPENQTATPFAFFEDFTGFGGFQSLGIPTPINTVETNQDSLILGLEGLQAKLIYTSNDINPFEIYLIDSELGSSSTFSAVNLGKGVMTIGERGIIITDQNQAARVDEEIPDQVFEISLNNNGRERVTAQRDYIDEWIYFTYPSNEVEYIFPNQTLFYNYKDGSWSIFNECYTTYGQFKQSSGGSWDTLNTFSWRNWNSPWNAGENDLFQPVIIAGNQQGFVLFKNDDTTSEDPSLFIENISGNQVTSPNHCLNNGDVIIINDSLGTKSSVVNGRLFVVSNASTNTFDIGSSIPSGTYIGNGNITRTYVPFIQTKQFPTNWSMARKTRIGVQQYLLSTTDNGRITLLIFLSQNSADPYNDGNINPQSNVTNDTLIYNRVLYTCPESTNLGLTPSNINLQMVTAKQQSQIWHRCNTSLLGDTVQLGFTISEDQMLSVVATGDTSDITGITNAYPCVLTCASSFIIGNMILITDVEGTIELNNNIYQVIDVSPTTVTIDVDSTLFGVYIADSGLAQLTDMPNQFSEIELHAFILDLSPSMVLA